MIIHGLVLGDGFLQKTGLNNARLRLEHSAEQREYMDWLYQSLANLFMKKPQPLSRQHPKTKRTYHYLRLQSHSSPVFGKLRRQFYHDNQKIIPENINKLLSSRLTLAIWYMDDGYYYRRDNSAHIYLSRLDSLSRQRLLDCLKDNFGLLAKIYCRPDRRACQLNFCGQDKDKLFELVSPYVIPMFNYKLPSNPVSTKSEK